MKSMFSKVIVYWSVRATCLSALFILWGCASGAHVIPSVSIPSPLIDSFPKTVGVYYSTELKDDIFEEEKKRQKYVIELGSNHEQVFDYSLNGLFEKVVTLDSLDPVSETVDGIFIPEIQGVTLATPAVTGQDYYEVLIRYSIRLIEPNGDEIHRWIVPGYGKVNRRDYGSVMERTSDALQQATENALRDASSQIIANFSPGSRPLAVSVWLGL